MTEHIIQYFEYKHLPPHLQEVSRNFYDLAHRIVYGEGEGTLAVPPIPRNPERTVALRKLLEAKDACVRAVLAKDTA